MLDAANHFESVLDVAAVVVFTAEDLVVAAEETVLSFNFIFGVLSMTSFDCTSRDTAKKQRKSSTVTVIYFRAGDKAKILENLLRVHHVQ